jgi:DNA ligase-4
VPDRRADGSPNPDFQQLPHFKDAARGGGGARPPPAAAAAAAERDFADALLTVIEPRTRTMHAAHVARGAPPMRLGEVNAWLDALAAAGSADARAALLQPLLGRLSPREHSWLARIICRDMRVGLKHDSILNMYHPDAVDAYNSTLSLEKTFGDPALRDPARRTKFSINAGVPFTPMLAKRIKMEPKDLERLAHAELFVETKLDGERIVLHFLRKGGAAGAGGAAAPLIRCLSRHSIDQTKFTRALQKSVLAVARDVD